MLNKKNDMISKSSQQTLKKATKIQMFEELQPTKNKQNPFLKLFVNSPKSNSKTENNFTKSSIPKKTDLKNIKIQKKKKDIKFIRPVNSMKTEGSRTPKHNGRPTSTKDKIEMKKYFNTKINNFLALDLKKVNKKQNSKEQHKYQKKDDQSQHKKLRDKLKFLEEKIMTIKDNIQKKHLKKSDSEKKEFVLIHKNQSKKQIHKKNEMKQPKKELPNHQNSLSKLVTQVKTKFLSNQAQKDLYVHTKGSYYVSQIVKSFIDEGLPLAKQHITQCLQTMKFMKDLKKPTQSEIQSRKILLPQKAIYKNKKTIIFDLDETLIHCNQSTLAPHDIALTITFPTGEKIDAGLNIRPHGIDILKQLSEKFQIIIFTASHPCYANVVIDHLDPENQWVSHRLYRDHCLQTQQGIFVKDLRILSNRNLSDIVLIDNAAYSYFFQLQNGIPIIPYYQGKNDFELKHLMQYLNDMEHCKDVRQINKKHFKLQKYFSFNNAKQLSHELYNQWKGHN